MLVVITSVERADDVMRVRDISIHHLDGGNTKMDNGVTFDIVPRPLWLEQYDVNKRN